MNKITFSEIKFNENNKPIHNGKEIGKWWGKTFYRINENDSTIECKHLTLIGRFFHHFFGYAKDFHRTDLKKYFSEKKINLPSETKTDHKIQTARNSLIIAASITDTSKDKLPVREPAPQKAEEDGPTRPPAELIEKSGPLIDPEQGGRPLQNTALPSPIDAATIELTPLQKLDATIAKLKEFKAQGYKIGVFIGRGYTQSLPKEKENWKWCSLDYTGEPKEASTLNKDRLHLEMDFNIQELMGKIQGLFTTVGVDMSVLKFMEHNDPIFEVLIPLLDEKEKNVTLITEKPGGGGMISENPTEYHPFSGATNISREDEKKHQLNREEAFNNFMAKIGKEAMENRLQKYIEQSSIPEWKGSTLDKMHPGNQPSLKGSFISHILSHEKIKVPHAIDKLVEEGDQLFKSMLEDIFEDVKMEVMPHPLIEEDPGEISHRTSFYIYASRRKT